MLRIKAKPVPFLNLVLICLLGLGFLFNPLYLAPLEGEVGTTLTVGSTSGDLGETVSIDIVINNNPGIAGGQFNLYFDPSKLEPVEAIEGGMLDNASFMPNLSYANNALRIVWAGAQDSYDDGTLCSLSFKILQAGSSDLSLGELLIKNAAPQTVPVTPINGSITGIGPDTTPPVITLIGDASVNLTRGASWTDPGATASDDQDGDISGNIIVGGDTVDTNTVGTYIITYNVSDATGNPAVQKSRTVIVSAPLSSEKQILSFAFNGLIPPVSGVINGTAINVSVPAGTDISALVPTITISDYSAVEPASGAAQNFANPVTYQVTAQDGSRQNYAVIVSVEPAAPVYNVAASFKVGQIANAQVLEGGKVLDAQVTVSAPAEVVSQEVLLIVALYDEEETMVNMSYMSCLIPAGESESFHAGFLLPDNVVGYSAKALVWQGSDLSNTNMMPISNVVEI